LTPKEEQAATSVSYERTTENVELNFRKQPATSMSIFDGRKVVLELQNEFVKGRELRLRSILNVLTLM